MKHLRSVLILFILVLSGCDSFEKKFYNAIDEGQVNAIKNKNDNRFDLGAITNFTWDSVLVIRGNESVPVFSEQIENDLKRPTTDLPVDKDRFYFLQHDKSIIIKELDSRVQQGKPAYDIELCLIDSTQHRSWLSRSECKFRLMSNSGTIGDGTVFLFPPCNTTVVPDSLKIFK
ncbi:hypothetical protein PQ469_22000 [Mucilaginibacter sp. KACC 22773]|uniref:hypothetical protein n=1 Tax=Mucilaginibacter sp. KACC 22773 TaxID=3025671 RepID=UPI002366F381|nr:hypothetical protein [Mucilaginibacter sp. KACC 22773]WDF76564.1 hypothetical protein PQ469_22000 [Mucilaginibacter sp. KACC 22773]